MRKACPVLAMLVSSVWVACGPSTETAKPPAPSLDTKEACYNVGHQFYVNQNYDSADAYLQRACAMDASYLAPLNELAQMHYSLGMQEPGEKNPRRLSHFRKAFGYFEKLEALGSKDSDVYERLSELSNALNDDKALVKYAKRNADAYPYERQFFNLGFAYFQAGEYQNVIKSQKEAIEKFRGSTYIGSFYRQLGRAYMKVDRDQTAERVFDAGLKSTDAVIADQMSSSPGFKSTEEYRRLVDDKIGMLISLKKLHQTYHADEKLRKVEAQLQELEHAK